MENNEAVKRLESLVRILDLKSDPTSQFCTSYRIEPFDHMVNNDLYKNSSIKEVLQTILRRRFHLLEIYKEIKNHETPASLHPGGNKLVGLSEIESFNTDEPYSLPLKLPMRDRSSCHNAVPAGDRVDDELFYTLVRILELIIIDPQWAGSNFENLISQKTAIDALQGLSLDFLLPKLMDANPNDFKTVFPQVNISTLPPNYYRHFVEDKLVSGWKRMLLRVMIVIYVFDKDLLEIQREKLHETLLNHRFPKTVESKTFIDKMSSYRTLLSI